MACLVSGPAAVAKDAPFVQAKGIAWVAHYDEPNQTVFDCTSLPGLDYLIIRYHEPSGFVHDHTEPASTHIYLMLELPSDAQSATFDPKLMPEYAKDGCRFVDKIYKDNPDGYAFLGVPFRLFHPFGGPVGGTQADADPNAAYIVDYVPRALLPQRYLKAYGGAMKRGETVELLAAESDDIVSVAGKTYYQTIFNNDGADSVLVCRAPLAFNGMMALPLSGRTCYYVDKGLIYNPDDSDAVPGEAW